MARVKGRAGLETVATALQRGSIYLHYYYYYYYYYYYNYYEVDIPALAHGCTQLLMYSIHE